MTAWQSGDVVSNGIRMHYTRTGGAKPALVLAHGVTDDGLCWTPVAEALAPDYDVVMVDARGHGLSEAPEQGYDAATQADDHAGLIQALGLHKPALLGHSMGAITMLALAGLHPGTPGAILLEDPPAWWTAPPEGPRNAQQRAGMQAWFTDIRRKTRDELIAEARDKNPAWPEAELGPWADSKLRFSPNIAGILSPGAAIDWPAALRCVACPALVITADPERGAALKPDGVAALQALVPHIQLVHIPGAGHNIRREQFTRYLEVVRAFLSSINHRTPSAGVS